MVIGYYIRYMNYQLTQHFSSEEFDSRDGAKVPTSFRRHILTVAQQLEIIRPFWGLPVVVHSGYRSLDHNRSVGGSRYSQHLLGKAADISISGISPEEMFRAFKYAIDRRLIISGGLKAYHWGIHYDIRGSFKTW